MVKTYIIVYEIVPKKLIFIGSVDADEMIDSNSQTIKNKAGSNVNGTITSVTKADILARCTALGLNDPDGLLINFNEQNPD